MLAMPRLTGSAAAFIAALASYRPLPNPPRRGPVRHDYQPVEARSDKAMARAARRSARRR
jgi:hypothetical protein